MLALLVPTDFHTVKGASVLALCLVTDVNLPFPSVSVEESGIVSAGKITCTTLCDDINF